MLATSAAHEPTPLTRFAYAGVSLELAGTARWTIADNLAECLDPATDHAVAHVLCSLHRDDSLADGRRDLRVTWRWEHDTAQIRAKDVHACVRSVGGGRYAATGRVAGAEASPFVRVVAKAILEREGGLPLHTASVELDGRAVLFVGPSGAGKTTASLQMRGCPIFSLDRAALFRTPVGWFATILPVAEAGRMGDRRTPHRTLPVAAILRVRQSASEPRLVTLTGAPALAAVRESTMSGAQGGEAGVLERIAELLSDVPVGEAHTALHKPLTAEVRTWLCEVGG